MKHPDVEKVLWATVETVEVSWKTILVDGNVRSAYDSITLWKDEMLAVEFLCKAKTHQAVTRTTLATWTENPNSLSEWLKIPVENFLKTFAWEIWVIIWDAHTLAKAPEPSWNVPRDIREVPEKDELLKAFIFWPEIAHIETAKVTKFLRDNAHTVMGLIGVETPETAVTREAA